jgi:hypothetical protein
MRPTRILAVAVVAAAVVAIAGCSAQSAPSAPSTAPQTTAASSTVDSTPATTSPSEVRSAPGRCAAGALAGSVQGSEGAAGHLWFTIQLRNDSAAACTLEGIAEVRLLDALGRPVTAPSLPDGPARTAVVLRPGKAARFSFSEPNACDGFVTGSRLRVTMPGGRGSLEVPLGTETRFGTCARVFVRAFELGA